MSLDKTIIDFFLGKGYKPAQARGIAAGIFAESSNDHKARNPTSDAMGLGQWLGSRKAAITKRFGSNPTKQQQLEFLHSELQGGDHGGKAVLSQDSAPAVLNAYVKKFMRPAAGRETTSDIQRGQQALGVKGGGQASSYERAKAARQAPAPVGEKGVIDGSRVFSKAAPAPKRTLSPTLIQAYNSHAMDDDPSARAEIDRAVKAGEVVLPRGVTLKRPAARTMGEGFGMGVRNVLTGIGGLTDIVGGPVNAIVNALPGDQGLSLTPGRDLANTASDAMGLSVPESSNEMLASALQEGGTQGIATAGLGAAAAGARGATGVIGRELASAPILDTISGASSGVSSEVARQSGAGAGGQLLAAVLGGGAPVAARPLVKAKIGRNAGRDIVETTQAPKEALIDPEGNLTPDGQEVAAQNGITPAELKQAYGEAPPGVANDVPTEQVAARAVGEDLPVEQIDSAPPMRAAPADEAATPVQEAPTPTAPIQEALPETALARVQAGKEFDIDYSRGNATKSFDVQDAEMRLRNSNGPEGEAARQFASKQIEQVKAAKEKFTSAFGDSDPELAQEAMRDLRDAGARGVSALYKAAEDVDGEGIGLLTDNIRSKAIDVLIDELVPEAAKTDLGRQLARYGIVGKADKMNEVGLTTSTLDDGKQVQFRGEVGPLTASNAEDLRQAVNRIYRADPQKNFPVLSLLPAIDDAFMDAIDTAIKQTGKDASAKGAILREARAASKELNRTFNASDVVSDIVGWKKGLKGVTSKLKPEQVMQRALATTSDLKRIKAVLLSSPTEKSRAAWRAIQAHGLAKIFDDATTKTTNVAGEITDAISGAKLRSAVQKFGTDKLKVMLDPEDFNNMMKLQRVIEDVTIPISGTVNHSNSGNLIMRLLGNVETKVTGAFAAAGAAIGGPAGAAAGGTVGQAVGTAVKARREAKAAAETLEGVTNYTPERAATEVVDAPSAPKPPRAPIKSFIDTYKSERLLAPIIAAGSQGEEE